MKNQLKRPLCATAAISAVLALSPTPALAQGMAAAEPPAPQAAPPTAINAPPPIDLSPALGGPVAVVPATTAPTVSTPVVQAVPARPEVQAPADKPPTSASTRSAVEASRAAERRVAAPARAPVAAAPPEATIVAPDPALQSPETALPIAAPGDVQASPPPQAIDPVDENSGLPAESFVGLLALLGAGGTAFAFWALRRRKAAFERSRPEVIVPYAPPVREPVANSPVAATRPVTTTVQSSIPAARTAVPLATVPQTEGKLPTGSARQALLDQMVAAAPDDANPFVSRKARRKRARIILQARDYREREANADGFDWRTHSPGAKQHAAPVPEPVTV